MNKHSFKQVSEIAKFVVAIAFVLATAACSNPKAVQIFSKMAPDPSITHDMSKMYVAEPRASYDFEVASGVTDTQARKDAAIKNELIRKEQAKLIEGNNTIIINYMKALGSLAGDNVVQSNSNVADLKAGLSSLQKAFPNIGITDNNVSLITRLLQAVANLGEKLYQEAKLADIIGQYNENFKALLDIQMAIVSRGIEKGNYGAIIKDRLDKLNKQRTDGRLSSLDYYLISRFGQNDLDNIAKINAVADAYARALDSIKIAHQKLYDNRNNILTKEMFDEIKGPAQEVQSAFEDIKKAMAK